MGRYWKLFRFSVTMVWRTARLAVLLPFVSQRDKVRARHQQRACAVLCRILGVRVEVLGTVPQEAGILIASNHLGPLDPLVLATVSPVAFAGKAEILSWPVIGWICRTAGLIAVNRDQRMRTNALVEAIRVRLERCNVVVFPEGTTSSGIDVLEFKTGAFAAVEGSESYSVLPTSIRVITIRSSAAADIRECSNPYTWADDRPLHDFVWEFLAIEEVILRVKIGSLLSACEQRKVLADTCEQAVRQLYLGRTPLNFP